MNTNNFQPTINSTKDHKISNNHLFEFQVLCELQIAMLEKGVEPKENIRRDIMGENIRDVESDSYRNIRDWSIYRDYMNGLEYALTVFNHMKNKNRR